MRTIRDTRLESRSARDRLTPRREPYWKVLVPGAAAIHLGYRRRYRDLPGEWLARRYKGGKRYQIIPLGRADDFSDELMSFADAQSEAYAKAKAAPGGGLTVADVIKHYIAWLRSRGKPTADGAEEQAAKLILPPLGAIPVSELTTIQLNRWLAELAASPALARTAPGRPQAYMKPPTTPEDIRRRQSSANRIWTTLYSALNLAFREGRVADDKQWRRVERFKRTSVARPDFLTIDEANRLVNAAAPIFRPLIVAALHTGARWSELTGLRVRDLYRNKIYIAKSKSGKPRDIVLTEEGVAFFSALVLGRAPDDLMFVRKDGTRWLKGHQQLPMMNACNNARLKRISFHALRHTWASLSVMAGMAMTVVARNLGHSNTNITQAHYAHLTSDHIDAQVKAYAPRFGFASEATNVRTLVRSNK